MIQKSLRRPNVYQLDNLHMTYSPFLSVYYKDKGYQLHSSEISEYNKYYKSSKKEYTSNECHFLKI
jgi:hypothetical protein